MSNDAKRDTTVKKVQSDTAPHGAMGQEYLVSGTSVAMRRWREQPGEPKPHVERPYETVGYVISGVAELTLEGQTIRLEAGDSWLVPEHAKHTYEILEPFEAIEATSPPARIHDRDGV
jgi:quercetin dioxygenase-like cupin family protein